MATDIQDEIREDLDTEVFDVIGKEVIITNYSSPTVNEWGEVSNAQTTSTITAVPYNLTAEQRLQDAMGDVNAGTLQMALRYDQSVSYKDKITMEGVTYTVSDIERNYLPGNVVTILTLSKDVE